MMTLTPPGLLIIDDDPQFRLVIDHMGRALGYRSYEAERCCAGVDVLRQHAASIDVVLMDYYMPGLTPVNCVRALREAAAPGSAIVLVTAAMDPRGLARQLELEHWLAKPFGMEGLRETLIACRARQSKVL